MELQFLKLIEEQMNLVSPTLVKTTSTPQQTSSTNASTSTQSPQLSSDNPEIQKEILKAGKITDEIKKKIAVDLDTKLNNLMQQKKQLGIQ